MTWLLKYTNAVSSLFLATAGQNPATACDFGTQTSDDISIGQKTTIHDYHYWVYENEDEPLKGDVAQDVEAGSNAKICIRGKEVDLGFEGGVIIHRDEGIDDETGKSKIVPMNICTYFRKELFDNGGYSNELGTNLVEDKDTDVTIGTIKEEDVEIEVEEEGKVMVKHQTGMKSIDLFGSEVTLGEEDQIKIRFPLNSYTKNGDKKIQACETRSLKEYTERQVRKAYQIATHATEKKEEEPDEYVDIDMGSIDPDVTEKITIDDKEWEVISRQGRNDIYLYPNDMFFPHPDNCYFRYPTNTLTDILNNEIEEPEEGKIYYRGYETDTLTNIINDQCDEKLTTAINYGTDLNEKQHITIGTRKKFKEDEGNRNAGNITLRGTDVDMSVCDGVSFPKKR